MCAEFERSIDRSSLGDQNLSCRAVVHLALFGFGVRIVRACSAIVTSLHTFHQDEGSHPRKCGETDR